MSFGCWCCMVTACLIPSQSLCVSGHCRWLHVDACRFWLLLLYLVLIDITLFAYSCFVPATMPPSVQCVTGHTDNLLLALHLQLNIKPFPDGPTCHWAPTLAAGQVNSTRNSIGLNPFCFSSFQRHHSAVTNVERGSRYCRYSRDTISSSRHCLHCRCWCTLGQNQLQMALAARLH